MGGQKKSFNKDKTELPVMSFSIAIACSVYVLLQSDEIGMLGQSDIL
jgi:hypothetical protein